MVPIILIRRAFSDTVRFYEIISFAGSGKLGKFKKIIIFLQRGIGTGNGNKQF